MNTRIHVIQTHVGDNNPPRIDTVTTDYDHAEKRFNALVENYFATYKTAQIITHGDNRSEIVVKHPDRSLFVDWLKCNSRVTFSIK